MIPGRQQRGTIGIAQGESVLEVTADILSLENGILDVAAHDLLVERAVGNLADRLTIHNWSLTVEKEGPECKHGYQGNGEKENPQEGSSFALWSIAFVIIAIARVARMLPMGLALLIGVALVH